MDITSLVSRSHERAKESGFWDEYKYNNVKYAPWCVDVLCQLGDVVEWDRLDAREGMISSSESAVMCAATLLKEIACDEDESRLEFTNSQRVNLALLLVATEIVEAIRRTSKENLAEELADIMIRTADLAGWLDIDLDKVISAKMDKNDKRPYRHGKKY